MLIVPSATPSGGDDLLVGIEKKGLIKDNVEVRSNLPDAKKYREYIDDSVLEALLTELHLRYGMYNVAIMSCRHTNRKNGLPRRYRSLLTRINYFREKSEAKEHFQNLQVLLICYDYMFPGNPSAQLNISGNMAPGSSTAKTSFILKVKYEGQL